MKIDLRKLNIEKNIKINEQVNFPEEYYKKTEIIKMSPLLVKGEIFINSSLDIELNLDLKGEFILPCAITLEEVPYSFTTQIQEIITETNKKDGFALELLDILWENTVLEVPLKVTKEGIDSSNLKGAYWQFESENL